MTPTDFRAALAALGLTQTGAAAALRVDARTVRRWAAGERRVPGTVERLLWAMEQWPELRLMLAAAPDDMELRLEAQAVAAWHGVGVTPSSPTNEGTE